MDREGPSLDVDMGLHPPWAWSLSLGSNSVPPPAVNNESLEIYKQENDRRGRFCTMGRPRGEKPASFQPQAPFSPRILPTAPLMLFPSDIHISLYPLKPLSKLLSDMRLCPCLLCLFLVYVCNPGRRQCSPVYPLATVRSLLLQMTARLAK